MRFAAGGLIPHPQIVWDNNHLFRGDGVHLSHEGTRLLLEDFYRALLTAFNSYY